MNEPTVQYAPTADGVSIAYTVLGQGPPLVYLQPYSHQQLDWRHAEMRQWYEALAERRTIIRYDTRRLGLSLRSESEISLATLVMDLEAVVQRAGFREFDLFGISGLGFPAAAYAAGNPERVRHLVLWATPVSGEAFRAAPRVRSLEAILKFDEELALELQARYVFGDSVQLTPERLEHAREVARPADLDAYIAAVWNADVIDVMRSITCPTLAIYPRGASYISSESAQRVAALVTGSEFVQVEAGYYPYQGSEQVRCLALIDEFLGTTSGPLDPQVVPGGFQTILFTDLEGSTAVTQRLGDEGAQELLRGHNEAVRSALEEHGGREVKHTGDGIMASFPSAVAAVTAALTMQRDLTGGEVRVRIGLNAGEPIAEDDDLFGLSVIKAARIGDRAEPGQVLVSDVVRQLCEGKTFTFTSIGDVTLKGFDEPVALYEVTV